MTRHRATRTLAPVAAVVAAAVLAVTTLVLPAPASVDGTALTSAAWSIRIHAGGGAVTDSRGQVWGADRDYIGGDTYAQPAARITGTPDPQLYTTERWGMSGYSIPVPAPGIYTLHLRFAEIWADYPGQRVFSVVAGGTTVVPHLDLVRAIGRLAAYDVTVPVRVTGRRLELRFAATANFAKISAIELDGSVPAPRTTPSARPTASPAPTTRPTATPAPSPRPTATPAPPSGHVVFNGDLSTGNLSQWEALLAAPDRAIVYSAGTRPDLPAPPGGGYAVALRADNNDFRSPNVRAQIQGPTVFHEGDDLYFHWATYFPVGFSTAAGRYPGFFTFAELMGAPFDGVSAAGAFSVDADQGTGPQRIIYTRSVEHNFDKPWSIPLTLGVWHDFVFHVRVSTNPSVGFVEIWHNGVLQTLSNGSTRIAMATLRANNWDGLFPVLTDYRKVDSVPGIVTVYHAGGRVATSYAAAVGR